MDPNANLLEQEQLITRIASVDHSSSEAVVGSNADVQRLAYLRISLKQWLQQDGFEPDWAKGPRARRFYGR